MKDTIMSIITIICVICIMGLTVRGIYKAGYKQGISSQNPMETRITDIVKEAYRQAEAHWHEVYNEGLEAGEKGGFDKGYLTCYNSIGMRWIDPYNKFIEFSQKYGSIHNTPWQEFALEEKATICMYGGSGSKMGNAEMRDFVDKYAQNPSELWVIQIDEETSD